MKKQRTKRQHWLPINSHLNNFAVDGKVVVYFLPDKKCPDVLHVAREKLMNPINVGVKGNLYEAPILPPNTIEIALGEIENDFGNILADKIIKRIPLNEEDHKKVAMYVSLLESRSLPQSKHLLEFISEMKDMGIAMCRHHKNADAEKRWLEKIKPIEETFFAQSIGVSAEVNKWEYLDFCFLYPAEFVKAKFITADHPVVVMDFTLDNQVYGLNHWNKTAECIVPLTPNITLFGNTCGITGYKEVDYNSLREINNRILRQAGQFVVSSESISGSEKDAITKRNTQSLILKYTNLPEGRIDMLLRASRESLKVRRADLL